ncbi:hypothetical protein [Peribacillus loiseleuriae]
MNVYIHISITLTITLTITIIMGNLMNIVIAMRTVNTTVIIIETH